jgi:nickel-dependent lactate racemase
VKVEIPYGNRSQKLHTSVDQLVEFASPKRTPANLGVLSESMASPAQFEDLDSFVSTRKKLLVVVNDYTRPTPTSYVLKQLNLRGKDATTIIASGTHREPNQREIHEILGGPTAPFGGRLVVHNSRDNRSLIKLGSTSRGTRLSLNRLLFDCDGIIVVGSVEPHYFAGYTGGRKFLLPALAGFESVVMNHALAVDDNARITQLDGNPVHEDFMDALRLFGRVEDIFSVQLVLNAEHQVSYASSGHIIHSFVDAVKQAYATFVASVAAQADIVITVSKPPMDIDFYQSQKAIENVKLAVRDGGIILLVSSCREGIGDRGFYDLLTSKNETIDNHKFGYHKAIKLKKLLERTNIFVVSDLPAAIPNAMSLTAFRNVQAAFDKAIEIKGKSARVLIVYDGSVVVPIPANK